MDKLHSALEHHGATLFGVFLSFNNQRTPATFPVPCNTQHFIQLFYIKLKVFPFLIWRQESTSYFPDLFHPQLKQNSTEQLNVQRCHFELS